MSLIIKVRRAKIINECDGFKGYSCCNKYGEYDEENSESDYFKFIEIINKIYDFTINNLETFLNKGLKYPTDYFSERCKYLRKSGQRIFINTTDSFENVSKVYLSLFDKPREELVNYYLNDILLYQYDKRLGLHKNDRRGINNYSKCNHHYLIDLDSIVDNYGIYRLYDDDGELVYIGKSYKLGKRIQTSLHERNCKSYDYCVLDTKEKADLYEIYYISKLKPKYNVTDINADISELILEELKFSETKNNYPWCIDIDIYKIKEVK